MSDRISRLSALVPLLILGGLVLLAAIDLVLVKDAIGPVHDSISPGRFDWITRYHELEADYADRAWAYTLAAVAALAWFVIARLREIETRERHRFFVSLATAGVAGLIGVGIAAVEVDTFPLSVPWATFLVAPGIAVLVAIGGLLGLGKRASQAETAPSAQAVQARSSGDPVVRPEPDRPAPLTPPPSLGARPRQTSDARRLGDQVVIAAFAVAVVNLVLGFVGIAGSPSCEEETPAWIETVWDVQNFLFVLGIGVGLFALVLRRPFATLSVVVVSIFAMLLGVLSSNALCT